MIRSAYIKVKGTSFDPHISWHFDFLDHKPARINRSETEFYKTPNLQMKESFNQKIEENKLPLTRRNTYF